MKRGELWWANLGEHRPLEQTGRRPVIVWQSDALSSALQSVLVVPLTTNLERAHLAGTAMIAASELGPPQESVALAFQMRAVPKRMLESRIRALTELEMAELEMATDEARTSGSGDAVRRPDSDLQLTKPRDDQEGTRASIALCAIQGAS